MRLGADPEIFLMNQKGPMSVIGLIGADKWNPKQMEGLARGFTLQEDNVALEYGIPPAASADEFVSHIKTVMEESKKYLPKDTMFSKLSCIVFPKEQMQHPSAFIFGCEPDWNAWTLEINDKPRPPHEFMRSAGGHVHVETNKDPAETVKMMDMFLSVPAVLMDEGHERKQLYGGPGSFRKKPYGVEYRTLSNFWIFEEKYIRWVWDQTARALESDIDINKLADQVQSCIKNNDKGQAEKLIKEYQLEVI